MKQGSQEKSEGAMTTKAQQPKLTNAERWGRDGCRVMGLKPDDLWVQKAQQPSQAAMDAAREAGDLYEMAMDAAEPWHSTPTAHQVAAIIDRHLAAERKEVREVLGEVIAALRSYAACSDGCTCGDGWDHNIACEALPRAAALLKRLGE